MRSKHGGNVGEGEMFVSLQNANLCKCIHALYMHIHTRGGAKSF